jgi:uncharacterized protein (TIGR02266 family)
MLPSAHTATKPETPREEMRRTRRAHIVTELNLHSGSNFYTGFTHDISEGGVFVVSYLSEAVGTTVTLDLGFPGGVGIHARGVVRWVREPRDYDDGEPPGMGIQFVDLDDEDRALIREFVENRAPLFHTD